MKREAKELADSQREKNKEDVNEKEKEKLRKEEEEPNRHIAARKIVVDLKREAKELADRQREKNKEDVNEKEKLIEERKRQPIFRPTPGALTNSNYNDNGNAPLRLSEFRARYSSTNEDRYDPEIIEETSEAATINSSNPPFEATIDPNNIFIPSANQQLFRQAICGNNYTQNSQTSCSGIFYKLINTVYSNDEPNMKKYTPEYVRKNAHIRKKTQTHESLTPKAYKQLVNSIKIVKNTGGGDCFFIAVMDAINNYNYGNGIENINENIRTGPDGIAKFGSGNKLFTVQSLRQIVYKYLNERKTQLDDLYLNNGISNTDNLNEKFEEQLRTIVDAQRIEDSNFNIDEQTYLGITNSIYKEDNFLVDDVTKMPSADSSDYYKPFKLLPREKLEAYINSPKYWANEIAVAAIATELKLNVIPISLTKGDDDETYTFGINAWNLVQDASTPISSDWDKYMFVYYNGYHYELINFEPVIQVEGNKSVLTDRTQTQFIFNKINELPPVYILFILFGCAYNSLTDTSDRRNFLLYPNVMASITTTLNALCLDKEDENNKNFFKNFEIFFGKSYKCPEDIDNKKGGQLMNAARAIDGIKKNDAAKLAYYITVDMVLHPGTSITPDKLKALKCQQKWNAVRRAYAMFIGKPYIIPPIYKKTVKNREGRPNQNKTKNNTEYINNGTQKAGLYKGGKGYKNKTRTRR